MITVSDTEVSFNTMETEYKSTLQSLTDRRIARGTQHALTRDADLISAMAAIEAQERADRQYAFALSASANAQPPAPHATPTQIGALYRRPTNPSSSSVASRPFSLASTLAESFASSQTSVDRSTR
jgi:hypothetical protein